MRATIRFEVNVDKVQQTMATLVREEVASLHTIIDLMHSTKPNELLGDITSALEHLHGVASQLVQYRAMVVSFEKTRLEPILPQPVEDIAPLISHAMGDLKQTTEEVAGLVANVEELKSATASADQFGSFLDKLNEFASGDQDEPKPKEG